MNRRDWLQSACMLSTGALAGQARWASAEDRKPDIRPIAERLALFTDHLDDYGYSYVEVAKMLEPLNIAGPDLTVRGGGVVSPERAAEELPKALAAFRDQGMSIPMISTSLTSADDPTARPILSAMAKCGIGYFKLGYLHYHDPAHWEDEIETERKKLAVLLAIAQGFGAQAGFHNHAGAGLGGAFWDAWELLKPLDPSVVGFYYDPGHATLEGAKFTWKLNLLRIAPRLKMVALKDYVWEKTGNGWQTRWVPLGEGMVNWKEFFQLLVKIPFTGPVSVHIEYDPGGSTRPERIDRALAAAQKDIGFVRKHLADALQ